MNLRRTVALLVAIMLLAISAPQPALSYLPQYTRPPGGGNPAIDHWDFSNFAVVWNLNPARNSNIQGGRSTADAIQASFNTWLSAPNAAVQVTRGADTSAQAGFSQDSANNTNVVCFVCTADFSDEPETLAVTLTTVANGAGGSNGHGGRTTGTGQILDSDILFNPNRTFSTDAGSNGVEDLQTIATHEIGHFFGLDHSGVVRAVMFAFAPTQLRTLAYDDVAALSFVYPSSAPQVTTGHITGTVSFAGGGGVFGAHVFAESVTGSHPFAAFNIRKSPISAVTLPDGSYRITGLPPDGYVVTAEPLDLPTENENIESYAPAWGRSSVQTNFTTRWF